MEVLIFISFKIQLPTMNSMSLNYGACEMIAIVDRQLSWYSQRVNSLNLMVMANEEDSAEFPLDEHSKYFSSDSIAVEVYLVFVVELLDADPNVSEHRRLSQLSLANQQIFAESQVPYLNVKYVLYENVHENDGKTYVKHDWNLLELKSFLTYDLPLLFLYDSILSMRNVFLASLVHHRRH